MNKIRILLDNWLIYLDVAHESVGYTMTIALFRRYEFHWLFNYRSIKNMP